MHGTDGMHAARGSTCVTVHATGPSHCQTQVLVERMELVTHMVDEAARIVPGRLNFRWSHPCTVRPSDPVSGPLPRGPHCLPGGYDVGTAESIIAIRVPRRA